MKTTVFGFLAVLLIGGCDDSVSDVQPAGSQTEGVGDPVAPQETLPAEEPETDEPPSAPAVDVAPSSNDAQVLLAWALERAQSDNKRVMVHLSATW